MCVTRNKSIAFFSYYGTNNNSHRMYSFVFSSKPDLVLTAAHCVDSSNDNGYVAVVDMQDRSGTGTSQTFQVSKMIYHGDYNDITIENDVALLKLDGSATNIAMIPELNTDPSVPEVGSAVEAFGFGHLESGGEAPSILQAVTVNTVSDEQCAERYSIFPDIMMCAAADGKGTCQGDSVS